MCLFKVTLYDFSVPTYVTEKMASQKVQDGWRPISTLTVRSLVVFEWFCVPLIFPANVTEKMASQEVQDGTETDYTFCMVGNMSRSARYNCTKKQEE